ncbi:MAG: TetR/AcrR family transcriptional regulator [Methanoregula sp.]|uniref:TetR/AcrR family transcriptional regulator n=1 Tax=Methanoregula sp. TaxID=2052170 RepID=UPI0025FE9962|nr:TetR/AcrR family transcriptional regulator [Methanoregula sp.]MCK9630429.1 TetR/AcrR family transcriptional regulator [Methanoregula sp.]
MPRINAHEEARKKIIAGALEVAAEKGWDAVTLEAIAQNVGVSKPALYSYFDNREALLRAIILEVAENIHDGLETILTQSDDIHLIIRNLAELLFEQQKPYASIFFLLPSRPSPDPKHPEEFVHLFDNSRMLLRDCLVRLKSKRELPPRVDPDAANYMIIAMTMGMITSSRFLEMDNNTVKKIWIEAMERYLLLGYGETEEPV